VTVYGLQGGHDYAVADAAGAARGTAPVAPGAALEAGAVGTGATGTNLQEAGVDEADLVKTDGSYVYVAGVNGLVVLDARGGALRRIATVKLPSVPQELLLDRGRLLAVGATYAMGTPDTPRPVLPGPRSSRSWPSHSLTERVTLTLIDVSTAQKPTVLGSETVDGTYVSARLVDGVARVVTTSSPRLRFRQPTWGSEPNDSQVHAAELRNRAVVTAATAADWLPSFERRDGTGKVVGSGQLLPCSEVRHPLRPSGYSTLSVLTIGLADEDPLAARTAAAVVASGELVYAAPETLYVVTTSHESAVLSRLTRAPEEPDSVIHAFSTAGRTTRYVASGRVDGYVPGRWGLSEHEGLLRVVATTGSPWGGSDQQTAVSVLERRGDRLERVGRVGGLGKDERVYAMRWFGDLGVVVTFRQTDPLYTIDLSDPRRPRVAGELKIPGFSAYLHPVSDTLLLGIGQDADEKTGGVRGMQASLFDLSDIDRPRRVVNRLLGQSHAAVEFDSRAFAYLPDTGRALLPTSGFRGESALLVLDVDSRRPGIDVTAQVASVGSIQRAVPVGRFVVVVGVERAALVAVADQVRTVATVDLD
jgi:uncharacterized secreted protein with C-terminal beta-propeller domain